MGHTYMYTYSGSQNHLLEDNKMGKSNKMIGVGYCSNTGILVHGRLCDCKSCAV